MFVCSVKSNTLKLAAIIVLAVVAAAVLIIMLPSNDKVAAGSLFKGSDTVNYDKIKTEDDRVDFLSQFGWEAKDGCVEEAEVKIPADFDRVMNSYNDLQKAQGLDLSEYKGKSAMRYTYEITNYPDYDGTVYANIIVYKNRVIGGDICSSDTQGFIQGFELPSESQ